MTRFWVGGYGADMEGQADGIGLLAVADGQGPTTLGYRGAVAPAPSPSWLAQHPTLDVVYAALEGAGEVAAFARTGERALRPLGRPVAAGQYVCHLAVSPDGRFLVASCYGDGRVVRIGLGPDGALQPDARDKAAELREALFGDRGAEEREGGDESEHRADPTAAVDPYASDPNRLDRSLSPSKDGDPRVSHAHAAAFLPDGRIATTDLGYDLVRIWRPAPTGLTLDHEVVLPRGSGPRHMVVHPSGHLHVVTEYSCELFTLAADREGRWGLVAGTPISAIATPGHDYPAELSRSKDGETLYAGVRGSNTVAALRVRGSGERVEPLALADAGVDWPRHHLVHDGALLVAGQRSDEITVLDLDDRTGAPGRIRHRTPAPAPTHLLPVR
ncbi:lactonase family protein [Microbacterium azadirachtae]|uniref:lactonase family protein n=1 Tax=Microbacterium azadirachtae TaxID=582680 RepID=UPI0008841E37|nr:beta-propeller fold lactonase family protein [Microbacterium azadirachtae]SDL63829.1 6-phosphogluconolactonase, cycloisomerase 2 family [Microbacterium azadirachtae]SEF92958.1 6-phosphogluconolactonase, cycloisomerase 2 family [Microbacterium azadirachtae]SEF95359.1 6-phosphogluconolactonase, cycloisomerase 2 family [Microbacterium azadirachtae]